MNAEYLHTSMAGSFWVPCVLLGTLITYNWMGDEVGRIYDALFYDELIKDTAEYTVQSDRVRFI